jgi:hypothetical protein
MDLGNASYSVYPARNSWLFDPNPFTEQALVRKNEPRDEKRCWCECHGRDSRLDTTSGQPMSYVETAQLVKQKKQTCGPKEHMKTSNQSYESELLS